MSCSKRTDNRSLFYAMAKDLYKDQNIASNFLDTINVSSFNKEEQMYGELLKIQATDLTDHDIKPYEKNISRIINYMQNKKDYTFLKLALYYAGRIKSEKDEAMKAVNFYTKAASIKDTNFKHKQQMLFPTWKYLLRPILIRLRYRYVHKGI